MQFKSKVAAVLIIPIYLLLGTLAIISSIYQLYALGIFFLFCLSYSYHFHRNLYYEINSTHLAIRLFPFIIRIKLADIEYINPVNNYKPAFAGSNKRLEIITYQKRYLVSPENSNLFTYLIREINPNVIINE